MGKQVRSTLVALLCVACMPVVLAGQCAPYIDSDYRPHKGLDCAVLTCSGTCTNRYCGVFPLDQSQFMCIVNNLYFIVGVGVVISLLICVGVIVCCCKTLCLCCGLCCPQRPQTRIVSTVVTNVVPPQPLVQVPYSSIPDGYQPVPSQSSHFGQPDKPYLPPPYPGADNLAFVEIP